jgi:integrase
MRWREHGRLICKSTHQTNRLAAEAVFGKAKERLILGKAGIEKEVPVYLNIYMVEYLAYSKANKRSWQRDHEALEHFKRIIGNKILSEIKVTDIEKYKQVRLEERRSKGKQISPGTVNRELTIIKAFFNKAVLWGKLKETPAHKVKKLSHNDKRIRYLELEEIAYLIYIATGELKKFLIISFNTGMRKSEVLNLESQDIDLRNMTIFIPQTKGGQSRTIPINSAVAKAVTGIKGCIFKVADIKRPFETACKKSGIHDFRVHDIRHTFAARLAIAGKPLQVIKELLGHKSYAMTLRYAHLCPNQLKEAVDDLGEILEESMTKSITEGKTPEITN